MKRLIAAVILILISLSAGTGFAQAEWDFELPLSVVTSEYAVLVNRENMLESADRPTNLVSVNVRKRSSAVVELDAVVAAALEKLFSEAAMVTEYIYRVKNADGAWEYVTYANDEGLKLLLVSGYRSYSSQYTIYNNYLARNDGVDDGISSPPGASEHQTGLACDVLSVEYNNTHEYMNETFYETPEAQWMEEFAQAYGFIIRYPKDKEEITQVPYEPWHLRYVGRDIAGYIKRSGLSYEEFTDEWQSALDRFLADGGNIQAQLLLESTAAPAAVDSQILNVFGEDGDPEVSLPLW
ncbi:MAG: M15 family metallopeptidase [Bacillota bacterium]